MSSALVRRNPVRPFFGCGGRNRSKSLREEEFAGSAWVGGGPHFFRPKPASARAKAVWAEKNAAWVGSSAVPLAHGPGRASRSEDSTPAPSPRRLAIPPTRLRGLRLAAKRRSAEPTRYRGWSAWSRRGRWHRWRPYPLTRASKPPSHRTALWSLIESVGDLVGVRRFFSFSRPFWSCIAPDAPPLPCNRARDSTPLKKKVFAILASCSSCRGHPCPGSASHGGRESLGHSSVTQNGEPFGLQRHSLRPALGAPGVGRSSIGLAALLACGDFFF